MTSPPPSPASTAGPLASSDIDLDLVRWMLTLSAAERDAAVRRLVESAAALGAEVAATPQPLAHGSAPTRR